jgi:hypothetical protein
MNKKILSVMVVLALALTVFMPGQALASSGTQSAPHRFHFPTISVFNGDAFVYISSAGVSTITGQRGPLVFETTVGEQALGQMGVIQGWDALSGAYFTMDLESNDAVLNMKTGTLSGKASGTIYVQQTDGSFMQGTFTAKINGNFYLDENGEPVFYEVNDSTTFNLVGVSGVFAGTTASGRGQILLTPVDLTGDGKIDTLGGAMSVFGLVRN